MGDGPKISMDKTTHDFGDVVKGEVVECDFEIKNLGDKDLTIVDARPSCGCTITNFDKTIKPGQSGKLHAKLDTRDFVGPIVKAITIESNDAETPYMKVLLKADIKTIVNVLPKHSIRFTKLERETITKVVTIVTETPGRDFEIKNVTTDKPFITTKIIPVPEKDKDPLYPNRQYQLQVTISPEAPVGTVHSEIKVTTNEPKVPKVTIRALGLVRPAVVVSPPTLTMGPITAIKDFKRSLLVVDSTDEPQLKILSVESDLSFLNFTVEEVEPGRKFKIMVQCAPDYPKGPFNGTITIKCDHPDEFYRTLTVQTKGELK